MATVYREHEADLVVTAKDTVAEGVVTVTLSDPNGQELPAWTPGAHIDLALTDSLSRQYSLCSSPTDRSAYRVGVLRDPNSRGGSDFVHDELHVGSTVRVRGPRNHFPLAKASRYVFIAGGIGITPILPMIEAIEADHGNWTLLYGGRQRASMAFLDELAEYKDKVRIQPEDEQGRLDLASVLGTPLTDTLIYTCGPEVLLNAIEESCSHWPTGSLRLERFKAKEQPVRTEPEQGFEVVFQRSGITTTVPPDKSVLEVAEEAGIFVLRSCMEGVCGTCEAEVIEGDIDHRDSVLTDEDREEGGVMMTCVSRCRSSRLILDL